jgi:ferredoxin
LEVAEDETILDASLDAGIDLPYDCKLGVCLVCSCKVQSGQIDQEGSALDDEVMQQGYALTCMSYPRSDAVITTVEDEELVNAQFGDKY